MTKTKKQKFVGVEPVMIYYKTGDDFEGWMADAKGDIGLAYTRWANSLERGVAYLRKMSEALKDSGATGGGGSNSISLSVPEALAKKMIAEKPVRPDPGCCEDPDCCEK